MSTNHRFKRGRKAGPGRKVRKGQTRAYRVGSRNRGGDHHGSRKRPF